MRIARVWMTNWMRFEGDNTVDLEANVYGIVGAYDGDARRSNWAGKTAFVEAIRFALFGVHRAAREDGWITHGAAGGSVTVTLSDGTCIARSRRRGQATKLVVERAGELSTGDAAQEVIARAIGFSRDDFEVTCWFGQKQMARLILARPVERFDLVSGWFGLDPLQRCEERVRMLLTEQTAENASSAASLQRMKDRLVALEEEWKPVLAAGAVEDALRAEVLDRTRGVQAAEVCVNAALVAVEAFADARRLVDAAEEYAEVCKRGKELAGQIDAEAAGRVDERSNALADARAASSTAAADLKAKRSLARGEFTGRCPVDANECPATRDINARTAQNAALYDAAEKAYDTASRREAAARLEFEEAVAASRKHDALVGRRDALRERARVLAPLAKAAPADFDAGEHATRLAALDEAHRGLSQAEERLRAATAALDEHGRLTAAIEGSEAAMGRLRAREAVGRAALRIFGRQGAQKQIAEAALTEIETGANAILREAGVDLSLRVQWGRDGVGLATWCAECGAPFPASARVKSCERCGAERGPKVVERLDIELSDRSGAAEDLAGAALQLAAAAWLRRERGVSWSVAFLDEPFGALDEANRRGFATHLVSMLRGAAGFEQAFIVAHHPDVIDGLPARLLVRAGDAASSIEAV